MDKGHGGYFYCNCFVIILILLAISSPNIIDLVLSIITYDNDSKKYYILRYITQGLCCLYSIYVSIYITYEPYVHPKGAFEGIFLVFILILSLLVLIPMEITSLVYFVKDFNSLESKAKIGYYIHLITFPCSIFGIAFTKCHCH